MLITKNEKEYIKPARIFGNLYFIGTRLVCTYLIDTGEGLIIIDPGTSETLNMIIDNVRALGFCTEDIKYIVISHAHYDHMDSVYELVKLYGAKTFIGGDDLPLLNGEIFHYPIKRFEPDILLNDDDVIELGNTRIDCVATPGHTDGTMSLFFKVSDGNNTYRAGMFGGTGTNTLTREFLTEHGLPFESRNKFIESVKKLKAEKVELFLGSHLENNRTEEKLALLADSVENPFITNSQSEWDAFLDARLDRIKQIIYNNE